MPSFAEAVEANEAHVSGSYRPVALFVGGTSGIGQGVAERFAHHTKGNAHIILCGRNKAAADKIIESFPKSANSRYEFLRCDATLIKNVITATNELKARLEQTGESINYLVLSQGIQAMRRAETEEGLDVKMTLHFYSRWKFVDELLPLLTKAVEAGQEARVMTVLAAGYGGNVNVDDLGLKRTYSMMTSTLQVTTYNDLFVKEYAKRYPKLSFTHNCPGWVKTPLVTGGGWWKLPLRPFQAVFTISPEKCGEWLLSALWSPAYRQGGFYVDNHGDAIPESKLYIADGAQEKLVKHYEASVAI